MTGVSPQVVSPPVISPCVGTCKLDEATSYCLGCARTGDEIATWRSVTEAERADVWKALPDRFAELGVACRRLPWTTDDIRAFLIAQLRSATGTWVTGVVGAVAEFCAAPGQSVTVEQIGDAIVAKTPGAALRFHVDDHVRALTFEPKSVPEDQGRIVLAVKRERGRPDCATGLTHLGPDTDAVDPSDRAVSLFDLGLGRKDARFCVRVRPGQGYDVMCGAEGTTVPDNLSQIGPALVAESPVRVVETALGRIEVETQIPPPGGVSPAGPHTHLLPDYLATGRALPTGFDLPRAYLPGAMFYPPSS